MKEALFVKNLFKDLFEYMHPYLSNYEQFSQSLTKEINADDSSNIHYSFDIELDKLIKKALEREQMTGEIFSEESGFFTNGKPKYRIVYDPFCNSSLATMTFHESAVGITIFDYNYRFITSGILDYQTGICAIVEDGKTSFYQIQYGNKLNISPSKKSKIKDSITVITLENTFERSKYKNVLPIIENTKRLIIGSGHYFWLKLATGFIDAYLDPFGGEQLYEMFACTVAQYAGCFVADLNGEIFDASLYLKNFEKNPKFIYYPISSCNKFLFDNLIKNIMNE